DARWVELTLAAVRAGHGALSGVVGVMRDVSTQVEAEEALRASEERYRLLAENMSDVLWLGDPEGNVLYVSPSVERQLGWRPADIIGDPTWNLTGEGEPEFRRAYGAILDGGGPERVLMYAPTAGGGMTWVESSLSGIRGQDQEVTRVIGVTRDVRAQIEAEAALRSSEERYRLLADNVTDTIWLTDADADGRIRYVSPSVERLLGRRPEDLVGRPGTDLLGPDAEVAIAALQRMAERREAVRVRVHLRRADGGLVWIESESTPLFDPDGAIVQVVSVVRDVTAQVEVEQALEAERDRLGAILAAVQDGLLVAGPEGDLLFANDAFCRMAGRDRATVEGTDPPFPWAPAGAEAMWDLTAPGERAAELVGADGDVLRVIMAVAALPAGGSVATVKDVTAMVRRAEHDRDQAREREELVAVVSHELRSPLAALATLLGVVAEEPADRPPSERQQARIVAARRSADRLRRLAGDLTVLAQQDAGRFTLRRTDADLAELAGQLIAAATPEAARSGVTLRGDLRPCIAYVDPDRVAQVIDNLVANAVKFTPDGGTVTVRVRGDAERALIEVADQGPGLPAEERERVFERYYQAPSSTRVAPGSGLGLAIARSVVDAHHGTVGLHDGPGGLGLVARVTLPR
ncbi:MAG: PAS domain S-box protein, partial [Thermoleophilia bacterium]|nr:PAS domain S-box protein [Thermoleophilia bacterium]